MREREKPALTGTEALSLFLYATAIPSGDLEGALDQVIEARKDKELTGYKARLLLGGAATDEVGFVGMIEELGGLVVTDALCYGSRAFWPHVVDRKQDDPYRALAENYLEKLLCPRMFADFPARKQFVFKAVERARVDGVVLVHNKFCDLHGVDNVQLRLALEEAGIPVLQLEKEYGAKADIGRMKTRVQAFLERIG
jgi:benzoyl-CoA reductase/2-hydroxyglutaryl-CoA dehydratase subunit BcrC/BadD/HgdB